MSPSSCPPLTVTGTDECKVETEAREFPSREGRGSHRNEAVRKQWKRRGYDGNGWSCFILVTVCFILVSLRSDRFRFTLAHLSAQGTSLEGMILGSLGWKKRKRRYRDNNNNERILYFPSLQLIKKNGNYNENTIFFYPIIIIVVTIGPPWLTVFPRRTGSAPTPVRYVIAARRSGLERETRPAAHYTRRWRRKKATGAVGRGERGKELMNGGFYYGRSPLPPHLTARRQYNNNDWIGRNDRDDHSTSIRSEPHPLAQTGESQRRGDRWEWLTRTRSGLKAMSEWSYLCPKASSPGGLGDQQFPS